MGMTGLQLFCDGGAAAGPPLMLTGLRLALVQVWATADDRGPGRRSGLGDVITLASCAATTVEALGGAMVVPSSRWCSRVARPWRSAPEPAGARQATDERRLERAKIAVA